MNYTKNSDNRLVFIQRYDAKKDSVYGTSFSMIALPNFQAVLKPFRGNRTMLRRNIQRQNSFKYISKPFRRRCMRDIPFHPHGYLFKILQCLRGYLNTKF